MKQLGRWLYENYAVCLLRLGPDCFYLVLLLPVVAGDVQIEVLRGWMARGEWRLLS